MGIQEASYENEDADQACLVKQFNLTFITSFLSGLLRPFYR